ncbi:MAG: hypothetical protein HQL50_09475, partial [Magnetococcales bacterium]|nr:hypothetical protein [Magnetococcales bacterium]
MRRARRRVLRLNRERRWSRFNGVIVVLALLLPVMGVTPSWGGDAVTDSTQESRWNSTTDHATLEPLKGPF